MGWIMQQMLTKILHLKKLIDNMAAIFNTIFVSNHMYPAVFRRDPSNRSSRNMGYIAYTARNRTHNLFRPKREPIPLGHMQ